MVATAQLHPLYGWQRSAPIAQHRKRPRPQRRSIRLAKLPKRAALRAAGSVPNACFAKRRLVPISPLTPTITCLENPLSFRSHILRGAIGVHGRSATAIENGKSHRPSLDRLVPLIFTFLNEQFACVLHKYWVQLLWRPPWWRCCLIAAPKRNRTRISTSCEAWRPLAHARSNGCGQGRADARICRDRGDPEWKRPRADRPAISRSAGTGSARRDDNRCQCLSAGRWSRQQVGRYLSLPDHQKRGPRPAAHQHGNDKPFQLYKSLFDDELQLDARECCNC